MKVKKNISLDKKRYEKFEIAMEELGLTPSRMLNAFMNEFLDVVESEGGEIKFNMSEEVAFRIRRKLKKMDLPTITLNSEIKEL